MYTLLCFGMNAFLYTLLCADAFIDPIHIINVNDINIISIINIINVNNIINICITYYVI